MSLMGIYTTKKVDEEGNDYWESTDGSTHKTRKAAWQHSKSLELPTESETKSESESDEKEIIEEVQSDSPAWTSFDFGSNPGDTVEVIPSTLKKIRGSNPDGSKKSKKQQEIDRQNNLAILKLGYRTGDHMMTRYRRALLEDPQAEAIKHTNEDYEWISEITDAALQENGIMIGEVVGKTTYAAIANGYWFYVPISRIHAESDKNPFKGRLAGVGRLIEKLPFLGKRIKARRLEKSLQTIDGGLDA
jgi:hypothetical protein|tara:strand:- start:3058 stop:3795 length:738 start_codon:yes stop_codon:yes gene_type:complete